MADWIFQGNRRYSDLDYAATITSQTYEHPVQPSDPAHLRWRTDIRFGYRICPPLLRSELAARAAPRLELLPGENG